MKVNVIADVLSDTGYGSHGRGLVQGLDSVGADVTVETQLIELWDRSPNITDKLIGLIKKIINSREVCVSITQPPFWGYKLGDRVKKFYGFLVWEGDKIPHSWVADCNDIRVTGILVPSEHTKKAAINSGVDANKIFVIPHGVDTSLFKPKEVDTSFSHLKDLSKCKFLFNKGWANGVNDRSGFDVLVKAFCEEFKVDEPVSLLVHINQVYNPPGWDFGNEINKLGVSLNMNVCYIGAQFPFNKLVSLYNCADFIVSSSRAEAFNLSVLEGMSCGLIPIVPDTGGEIDFVNVENGYVYGNDGLVKASGYQLMEDTNWLQPSKEQLKQCLRRAFNDWQGKQLGEKRKACLEQSKRFTWECTAEKLLGVLK